MANLERTCCLFIRTATANTAKSSVRRWTSPRPVHLQPPSPMAHSTRPSFVCWSSSRLSKFPSVGALFGVRDTRIGREAAPRKSQRRDSLTRAATRLGWTSPSFVRLMEVGRGRLCRCGTRCILVLYRHYYGRWDRRNHWILCLHRKVVPNKNVFKPWDKIQTMLPCYLGI